MKRFGFFGVTAGTAERESSTSVYFHDGLPGHQAASDVTYEFSGPYQSGGSAEGIVTIRIKTHGAIPDKMHVRKYLERKGRVTMTIPFLIEMATEALKTRRHELTYDEARALIEAVSAAMNPPRFSEREDEA